MSDSPTDNGAEAPAPAADAAPSEAKAAEESSSGADNAPDPASPAGNPRTFLVVADESAEMEVALHYACRRAKHTGGRVALLHVIDSGEVQQWAAVEDMIRAEKRQEAEQKMHKLARQVQTETGGMAIIHVREGKRREELLKLIEAEESLSILVLAAAASDSGPGPLVSHVMEKGLSRLRIPVVVIPGGLSIADIDQLT
ncbi:MAG: universal stress protein [Alphaproteobacteria bacterium]|nr:universal stress protein [Alphaproteobacteria bacterium SS10]